MALTECPDCGGKISTEAAACPHCGKPVERTVTCSDCGERYPADSRSCPGCGRLARSDMPASMKLRQWLSFKGRASRFEYWVHYMIPIGAVGSVAALIDLYTGNAFPDGGGPLNSLVWLASLWPGLAVTVKRFKDVDPLSSWEVRDLVPWSVLSLTILCLLFVFASGAAVFLMGLLMLAWVILLGFVRGTRGPNRYGEDPVGG